ncbi:MAG: nucleotidyltransferase [Candidatus Yanofskybacteria bacterium]|nr:nucleotidyltransferase [Candidatus Yanofskybacteria bacterium]
MEQEKLLLKLGKILGKLKIPYLISGGIAVVVWGRPRFTADIDIVVEISPEKLDALATELLAIDKDVYVDRETMEEALKKAGEFNFIHPASGLKVDFWIFKNDDFDKERMKRRIKKQIAGQKLYFSSPEDLILIKLLWFKDSQSTRQLEDISSILRIQDKLNISYIKKWAKRQRTLDVFENLLKT